MKKLLFSLALAICVGGFVIFVVLNATFSNDLEKEIATRAIDQRTELRNALAKVSIPEEQLKDAMDLLNEREKLAQADIDAELLANITVDQKMAMIEQWFEDPDVQRRWWGAPDVREAPGAVETTLEAQLIIQEQARTRLEIEARQSFSELFDEIDFDNAKQNAFIQHWVDARVEAIQTKLEWEKPDLTEEEEAAIVGRFGRIKSRLDEKTEELFGRNISNYLEYRKKTNERDAFNRYSSLWGECVDQYDREAIIEIMYEEQEAAEIPKFEQGITVEERLQWNQDVLALEEARDAAIVKRSSQYLTDTQLRNFERSLAEDRSEKVTVVKVLQELKNGSD